jgi:hypothetical protein
MKVLLEATTEVVYVDQETGILTIHPRPAEPFSRTEAPAGIPLLTVVHAGSKRYLLKLPIGDQRPHLETFKITSQNLRGMLRARGFDPNQISRMQRAMLKFRHESV